MQITRQAFWNAPALVQILARHAAERGIAVRMPERRTETFLRVVMALVRLTKQKRNDITSHAVFSGGSELAHRDMLAEYRRVIDETIVALLRLFQRAGQIRIEAIAVRFKTLL